ncbi:MAG: GNAT family N-acetyltransferase [Anaerolineae bacterium]
MTEVRTLTPDDEEWTRVLNAMPHDFYHLPAYVRAVAIHEGGRALGCLVRHRDARLFIPLIVREISEDIAGGSGWFDARSPYGYGAPLAQGCEGALLGQMFQAAMEHLRSERIVSVFLRLHPLMPLPEEPLSGLGDLVDQGETVYVDLNKPGEELWNELRSDHQQRISQLKTQGFEVCRDDWSLLPDFEQAYEETMSKVAADDFYFFGEDFFNALAPLFGSALHLFAVKDTSDRVACAGLYGSCCGLAQNFLSATYTAHRSDSPARLMQYAVVEWGKQKGDEALHLGGGLGGAKDGIFRYKSGFSPLRAHYKTLRLITDPAKYDRFVSRRLAGDRKTSEGFFPQYRA